MTAPIPPSPTAEEIATAREIFARTFRTNALPHKAVEVIAKLLAESHAQVRASGFAAGQVAQWQPIETAPRDHTPVIVAVRHRLDVWSIGEARFEPEVRGGSWWWANIDEHDFDGPAEPIIPEPQLWQPLPAPPRAAAPEEGP